MCLCEEIFSIKSSKWMPPPSPRSISYSRFASSLPSSLTIRFNTALLSLRSFESSFLAPPLPTKPKQLFPSSLRLLFYSLSLFAFSRSNIFLTLFQRPSHNLSPSFLTLVFILLCIIYIFLVVPPLRTKCF